MSGWFLEILWTSAQRDSVQPSKGDELLKGVQIVGLAGFSSFATRLLDVLLDDFWCLLLCLRITLQYLWIVNTVLGQTAP